MSNLLSSDQPKMFPSYQTFFTPSYQEDFGHKTAQRVQCIRTGSSSGDRRNNPHPPHAFMVWRYPRNFLPDYTIDDPSAPIPPINLACPNTNIASTYQMDFERPTTRVQALSSHPSSNGGGPTTAEPLSTQGWSFQPPKLSRRLRGNTTRYGCSHDKIKPACGAVPTISARECGLFSNQDTSYSESYQPQPQATCQLPKLPLSVSRRQQQRGSNGSGAGKRSLYQPSWLSQWTGPS